MKRSTGDAYDNALAETINGLYKTEIIKRQRAVAVTPATGTGHPLEWARWFNTQRLLEPIGTIPPMEAEAKYFSDQTVVQARVQNITLTT